MKLHEKILLVGGFGAAAIGWGWVASQFASSYASDTQYTGHCAPGAGSCGSFVPAEAASRESDLSDVVLIENPTRHLVVREGDNLDFLARVLSIQEGYSMSWQDLYSWNKDVIGDNPGLIQPGMNLTYVAGFLRTTSTKWKGDPEVLMGLNGSSW
jgi:hypothetical protein